MKMPTFWLVALWLIMSFAFCYAQEDTILAEYTHPVIRIGMSQKDLVMICPRAIVSNEGNKSASHRDETKVRLAEFINRNNCRAAVWYVLR